VMRYLHVSALHQVTGRAGVRHFIFHSPRECVRAGGGLRRGRRVIDGRLGMGEGAWWAGLRCAALRCGGRLSPATTIDRDGRWTVDAAEDRYALCTSRGGGDCKRYVGRDPGWWTASAVCAPCRRIFIVLRDR
jgi:hypothetical protein